MSDKREDQLIAPEPITPATIRSIIETYRAASGLSLMEAILHYTEKFGVEVEAMTTVIQGNMKTELEMEARSLHMLKPAKQHDPKRSKKSASGAKNPLPS